MAICDGHSGAALALAKLWLAKGEAEKCEELCFGMLDADSQNKEAQMMLAQLLFHQVTHMNHVRRRILSIGMYSCTISQTMWCFLWEQGQYETALYHFEQILERQPDSWSALAQLLSLLRRAGRLSDAPAYIASAEASAIKSTSAGDLCTRCCRF